MNFFLLFIGSYIISEEHKYTYNQLTNTFSIQAQNKKASLFGSVKYKRVRLLFIFEMGFGNILFFVEIFVNCTPWKHKSNTYSGKLINSSRQVITVSQDNYCVIFLHGGTLYWPNVMILIYSIYPKLGVSLSLSNQDGIFFLNSLSWKTIESCDDI